MSSGMFMISLITRPASSTRPHSFAASGAVGISAAINTAAATALIIKSPELLAVIRAAKTRPVARRKVPTENQNALSADRSEFYMAGEITARLGVGEIPRGPGKKAANLRQLFTSGASLPTMCGASEVAPGRDVPLRAPRESYLNRCHVPHDSSSLNRMVFAGK